MHTSPQSKSPAPFGIHAIFLGAALQAAPSLTPGASGWPDAVTVEQVARAGGRAEPVTPTRFQAAWDQEKLYLLAISSEPSAHREQERRGIIDVVISSGDFGHRDFAVFSISRSGEQTAFIEKGMTYIGGDEAFGGQQPNDRFEHIENEAEITPIESDAYTASLAFGDGWWSAGFAIPWALVGGFPKGNRFALQLYRKRQLSGEILSPVPQDVYINLHYWFEYDPALFMEATLGGQAQILPAETAFLTLPSGLQRWSRPSENLPPQPGELQTSWQALTHLAATDAENVAEHVRLAQRLQDILTLEGVDFFWDEAGSRPIPHVEPWNERHVFNELLYEGKAQKAYQRLDAYLQWLKQYIHWYYTDGTLAEQSDAWAPLTELHKAQRTGDHILLSFSETTALALSFADHGFRLKIAEGGGRFDAAEDPISELAEGMYAAGDRLAVIHTGADWSIELKVRDRSVVTLNAGSLSLVTAPEKDGYRFRLPIGDTPVTGFGERFNALDQRGRIVALYQRDTYLSIIGGEANESYKNIPLIHLEGKSLFLNSTYRLRADVGAGESGLLSLTVQDPTIDLFIWAGTPLENMTAYAQLTGMPLLPPKWVFEPWAGGGGGRWANGPLHHVVEEQIGVLQRFQELDIPHAGFYAEGASAMWRSYEPTEIHQISRFAEEHGVHAFSWDFSVMPQARAEQLLAASGNTSDLPITRNPGYQGKMRLVQYVDFSHPRAMELLRAQWANRFAAGIRGTMVDFGDKIADNTVFYDGRGGKEMHNGYALDYARGYHQLFEEAYGDDHVLYQRAGAAGCQSYACHFGGDQPMTFVGMRQSLLGGLSAAASGLPFWGADACGYDGFAKADAETYLRWTAWAAFCPIMRYHGTKPKEPWEYHPEAVRIYRYYAWLRENLLPYSYSTAIQAHHTGIPMMRPLSIACPGQPCQDITDAYFYGDHLLVAPIYTEGDERTVSFPAGRYVNLFHSDEVISGSQSFTRSYPLEEIPVYLSAGAVLPLQLNESLQLGDSMTPSRVNALLMTPPMKDTDGTWYDADTARNAYHFSQGEQSFRFTAEGTAAFSYLLVKGIASVRAVTINGCELPQAPAKQGLNQHQAWFQAADGTLMIRVWSHHHTELTVSWQE